MGGLPRSAASAAEQPVLLLDQEPPELVQLRLAGGHVPQQTVLEAGPESLDHLRRVGGAERAGSVEVIGPG